MDTSEFNQLHGSSSLEEAEREVELLFPVQQTVAVIKPSGLSEKGMCVCVRVYVCVRAHMRVCVRTCVRACVRAYMRVCD